MKIVLIISFLLACDWGISQDDGLLEKTLFMIETEENYIEAIALLDNYIKTDPHNVEAFWQKAMCQRKIGLYKDAFMTIDEAILIDSANAKVYGELGSIYALTGDYPTSLKYYDKSLIIDTNYAASYNNRGILYFYFLDDLNHGLKDFTRSIQIDPNDEHPYYNRAMIYRYQKNYEKALQDLSMADSLSPNDHQTLNEFGLCYYQMKEYEIAERYFTKALQNNNEIDPYEKLNLGTIYYHRSVCYKMLGENKKAKMELKRATENGYIDTR